MSGRRLGLAAAGVALAALLFFVGGVLLRPWDRASDADALIAVADAFPVPSKLDLGPGSGSPGRRGVRGREVSERDKAMGRKHLQGGRHWPEARVGIQAGPSS